MNFMALKIPIKGYAEAAAKVLVLQKTSAL